MLRRVKSFIATKTIAALTESDGHLKRALALPRNGDAEYADGRLIKPRFRLCTVSSEKKGNGQ